MNAHRFLVSIMFVLWMYNKALNAGLNSRETVSFVFPRVPMFPLTSSRKY